jgi:hypothetical protein
MDGISAAWPHMLCIRLYELGKQKFVFKINNNKKIVIKRCFEVKFLEEKQYINNKGNRELCQPRYTCNNMNEKKHET